MSKKLRLCFACLLLLLFHVSGALAQSPVEKKRVTQPGPEQSAKPRSSDSSAVWSTSKGRSRVALRGLRTLQVVFDVSFSFPEFLGPEGYRALASVEGRIGEAGLRILKGGEASASGPKLFFAVWVIKDKDDETYFGLSARLIEPVTPSRDLSKTFEAATWHTEKVASMNGTMVRSKTEIISKAIELMTDDFVADHQAANQK